MSRRGKRAVFETEVVKRAEDILNTLPYGSPVLMSLSVLLAARLKLTCDQIGSVLGIGEATVIRMNQRFRSTMGDAKSNWGGRRYQALTAEEEKAVLGQLEAAATRGEVVGAKQVKVAIERRRGKPISLQTAYNCLARGGWRKVVPDKVHPKQDPEKQEEFKKKSSRRRSRWLPPKLQASPAP